MLKFIGHIKREYIDELSDDIRGVARGLATAGRNAPAIGNTIESAQQLSSSVSKFMSGQKKDAGMEAVKGVATFMGIDAQMLSENANQIRTAFKHGGIVMGISSTILGVTEVVGSVISGSQFIGSAAREMMVNNMFGSRVAGLESKGLERTHSDVNAAKQSMANIANHHRFKHGAPSKGP